MPDVLIHKPETIQEILVNATRALGATMEYHEARLQAEILLAHTLETTRAMVLARLNETLAPEVAARFAANVARRAKHEPLAYIIGHQEFYGLDFIVDRRVLIPRHETETLVHIALDRARTMALPTIVDVGTGSGALALTLAYHLPHARLFALDQSRDALEVARLNAKRLNVETRVKFLHSDLLAAFTDVFDVLVANLPYIPTHRFEQLPREIRVFEPRAALDGGEDGLAVMRRLLAQLQTHANRNAIVLLEISEEQGKSAMEAAYHILPRAVVTLHRDLEGLDRVLEIQMTKDE
jgi:release factor glutamine methyltransferase